MRQTGEEAAERTGEANLRCVRFAPDGQTLAAARDDGRVDLWVWQTDENPRTVAVSEQAVYDVAFSPDGERLVVCGGDWRKPAPGFLKVLRTGDLTIAAETNEHQHAVRSVAFNSDGTRMASVGETGLVIVWNVESLLPTARFKNAGGARPLALGAGRQPDCRRPARWNDSRPERFQRRTGPPIAQRRRRLRPGVRRRGIGVVFGQRPGPGRGLAGRRHIAHYRTDWRLGTLSMQFAHAALARCTACHGDFNSRDTSMTIARTALVVCLSTALSLLPAHRLRADENSGSVEDDLRRIVAVIDGHLESQWRVDAVTPSAAADDAEYLRRATLDINGWIPSVMEARQFLADEAPDKRQQLVDRLLDDPRYAVHFTNYWRRILIPEAESDLNARYQLPMFEAWLRTRLLENRSYRDMVREILDVDVSAGNMYQYNSVSPVAFYATKEIKPENLAAATARMFLGVRLECAQCHDHPFDPLDAPRLLGLLGVLRRAAAQHAGAAGVSVPIERTARPAERSDSGHERVRRADLPGRDSAGPRFAAAAPAGARQLDRGRREPVLRADGGQSDVGPLFRNRIRRPD